MVCHVLAGGEEGKGLGWAREGAVVESGQRLRRSESINTIEERVCRVEDEERERG